MSRQHHYHRKAKPESSGTKNRDQLTAVRSENRVALFVATEGFLALAPTQVKPFFEFFLKGNDLLRKWRICLIFEGLFGTNKVGCGSGSEKNFPQIEKRYFGFASQ